MVSYSFSLKSADAALRRSGPIRAIERKSFVVTMGMLVLHAVGALLVLFFRALARTGH